MMSRSSFVADLDTLLPGAVPHVPCVSVSLSHRKDPGAGRERRGGARRCRGRVRGVGAVPPGSDVRYRGDPGGAAHSIGASRQVIGGIMRKSLGAQRCWNPPMCRAGPSAHGSPSAENQRSRKNPGIARKTRNRFVGTLLSDVQRPRTDREESDSPEREPARSPARPSPAGGRHPPPHPSRPPHRRSRREKLNAPTGAWCSQTLQRRVSPSN